MGEEKEAKKTDGRVTETDPEKKAQMKDHRKRLRDRYLEHGMDSLQDYEVLELLLQFATPQRDTKEMAKQLIAHFGSLPEVLDASYDEIIGADIPRVRDTAATLLTLVKGIENRYHKEKGRELTYIRSTLDAGKACCAMYRNQADESVRILCLNARGKIVKREEVAKGDVNAVHFPVRKIVETAVIPQPSRRNPLAFTGRPGRDRSGEDGPRYHRCAAARSPDRLGRGLLLSA